MTIFDEYIDQAVAIRGTGRYNVHKNVKLTEDQAHVIEMSGESDSQWIREAVQMRIDRGE